MILFYMIVYLGCYTDETHPNGLKALQLDEKSGAMAIVAERERVRPDCPEVNGLKL